MSLIAFDARPPDTGNGLSNVGDGVHPVGGTENGGLPIVETALDALCDAEADPPDTIGISVEMREVGGGLIAVAAGSSDMVSRGGPVQGGAGRVFVGYEFHTAIRQRTDGGVKLPAGAMARRRKWVQNSY